MFCGIPWLRVIDACTLNQGSGEMFRRPAGRLEVIIRSDDRRGHPLCYCRAAMVKMWIVSSWYDLVKTGYRKCTAPGVARFKYQRPSKPTSCVRVRGLDRLALYPVARSIASLSCAVGSSPQSVLVPMLFSVPSQSHERWLPESLRRVSWLAASSKFRGDLAAPDHRTSTRGLARISAGEEQIL